MLVIGAIVHFVVCILLLGGALCAVEEIPLSKKPNVCASIAAGLIALAFANMIP